MEQLNGAWEPRGYIGPRAEIEGNRIAILWRGLVVLDTTFAVKEENGVVHLMLKETAKRYPDSPKPYAEVTDCRFENGELTIEEYFPITGPSSDTLVRTQNTRYGRGTLLPAVPDELLGEWVCDDWRLRLEPHVMFAGFMEAMERFDVVALRNESTGEITIRDERPWADGFGMFRALTVRGMTIVTYMEITDVTPPPLLFTKRA